MAEYQIEYLIVSEFMYMYQRYFIYFHIRICNMNIC